MTINEKYVELIHADIDGELSEMQRAELYAFLDSSEEGKKLHGDLSSLCQTMSSLPSLDPPPHLRHVILNSIRRVQTPPAIADRLKAIFTLPTLRYAGAFAAGVLLALAFVGSDRSSKHAFDDLTDLVGTISSDARQPIIAGSSMHLTTNEIAGTVSLSNAGPVLVLDFDLTSHQPIKIIADFSDPDVWFNGFAQLENEGTSVLAETGRVTLFAEGKRRYAMYLHNVSGNDAIINLKFYIEDALIHEGELRFNGKKRIGLLRRKAEKPQDPDQLL